MKILSVIRSNLSITFVQRRMSSGILLAKVEVKLVNNGKRKYK